MSVTREEENLSVGLRAGVRAHLNCWHVLACHGHGALTTKPCRWRVFRRFTPATSLKTSSKSKHIGGENRMKSKPWLFRESLLLDFRFDEHAVSAAARMHAWMPFLGMLCYVACVRCITDWIGSWVDCSSGISRQLYHQLRACSRTLLIKILPPSWNVCYSRFFRTDYGCVEKTLISLIIKYWECAN